MATVGGSGVLQILQSFRDQVDADLVRTQTTWTSDIAMVLVSGAIGEGSKYIEPCQDLVDEIKLLDTRGHHCPRIKRMASSSPIVGVVSRELSNSRCKFLVMMSLVLDSEARI